MLSNWETLDIEIFFPSQNPPALSVWLLWLVHAVVSQQVHPVGWGYVQVDMLQVQQHTEPQR